jgi:hypothetical protein
MRTHPDPLPAGSTAACRSRTATVKVASLAPVLTVLKPVGGEVVDGLALAPNGTQFIARYPDGAVFQLSRSATPNKSHAWLMRAGPRS